MPLPTSPTPIFVALDANHLLVLTNLTDFKITT